METQSVAETLGRTCKIRPSLRPYLDAFEPLFTQRRATAAKLAPLLAEAGITLTGKPAEKPLLAERQPGALAPFIRMAAEDLLPPLLAQKALAGQKDALESLFLRPEYSQDQERLVGAMLQESPAALIRIAEKYGLEPQVLKFASEFIVSAVLRGLAANSGNGLFPDWRKSECPICGMPPTIAWLSKRPISEGNAFLVDGGGRKHLHCGMCGSDWYFVRGVCPGCGSQGEEAMQILGEEDKRHERIDWCKNCQTYLPLVDLREMADTPDMDAMALAMMHLDIAAAERELLPLKPSFWNMF